MTSPIRPGQPRTALLGCGVVTAEPAMGIRMPQVSTFERGVVPASAACSTVDKSWDACSRVSEFALTTPIHVMYYQLTTASLKTLSRTTTLLRVGTGTCMTSPVASSDEK